MKNILLHTFFSNRVYWLVALVAGLTLLSYWIGFLFWPGLISALFLLLIIVFDALILFLNRDPFIVERLLTDRFSNGDQNPVTIRIISNYKFPVNLTVIDELPDQFQKRDFSLVMHIEPAAEKKLRYSVRPVQRGIYRFHDINLLVSSPLKLVVRRKIIAAGQSVKVMPAFLHLRKYTLLAMESNLAESGSRRMRKFGHSLEFEQIRDYITGDDVRSINWTATARKGGQLMVNSFVEERSQQVYCIIDKSRVMKMPFQGMTLLDYAINATLVLSKVALIKHDKAGLVTFDEKPGTILAADYKAMQIGLIMETLYNQETNFLESDFEQLQLLVRTKIAQRSLVILFTNFESMSALERQLPYIRNLARYHLVLVVFFENTGLAEISSRPVENLEDLYIKTITEKFILEKRQMVKELYKYGVLALLTTPKQLTLNTVNKYLELKSRQLI